MMNDNRVGIIRADRVEFPATTISGGTYERPATMVMLGGGLFAVLDAFPPAGFDVQAEVDALREKVRPRRAEPMTAKGKKESEGN